MVVDPNPRYRIREIHDVLEKLSILEYKPIINYTKWVSRKGQKLQCEKNSVPTEPSEEEKDIWMIACV